MQWLPENWFPFTEQNSLKTGSCDSGDDRDENIQEKEGVRVPYYVLIVGLRVCIRDLSLRVDISMFTFAQRESLGKFGCSVTDKKLKACSLVSGNSHITRFFSF